MPKVDVFTITGRKSGKVDLPKEIFAAQVNSQLIAQAARVYLVNQRKAGAKTKSRGEVTGSRRKIWRQKGTGRARHGDRYAPIFVGGGVAHGPTGKENYQLRMSKKMKKRALFAALTSEFKNGEILVIKGLAKVEPKTKAMIEVIKNLKLEMKNGRLGLKVSIILPAVLENIKRAGRNIANLRLMQASRLNTYEVLNGGKLILMKESIEVMKETFLDGSNKKLATLKR